LEALESVAGEMSGDRQKIIQRTLRRRRSCKRATTSTIASTATSTSLGVCGLVVTGDDGTTERGLRLWTVLTVQQIPIPTCRVVHGIRRIFVHAKWLPFLPFMETQIAIIILINLMITSSSLSSTNQSTWKDLTVLVHLVNGFSFSNIAFSPVFMSFLASAHL